MLSFLNKRKKMEVEGRELQKEKEGKEGRE
jgi:hypothetical protein